MHCIGGDFLEFLRRAYVAVTVSKVSIIWQALYVQSDDPKKEVSKKRYWCDTGVRILEGLGENFYLHYIFREYGRFRGIYGSGGEHCLFCLSLAALYYYLPRRIRV